MIDLKGEYATTPLEIRSTKSIDPIWSDITRLFATKGSFVEGIEKSKGVMLQRQPHLFLFIPLKMRIVNYNTGKRGIVLPKVLLNKKQLKPKSVHSQWSI